MAHSAQHLLARLQVIGEVPAEVREILSTYRLGDGQDDGEDYEAQSLDDAASFAADWAEGGDWGKKKTIIDVRATDWTGATKVVELVVGKDPEPPTCAQDGEHEWDSPRPVVGGGEGNPGEFGVEGNRIKTLEMCVRCGCYRHSVSESQSGQYPREPKRTWYTGPDEQSLAWVAENSAENE